MKRRQFIASISLGTFSVGLFESIVPLPSNGFDHDSFVPHDLLKIIEDEQAIIEIGRRYREMNADEHTKKILIDKLVSLGGKQRANLKNSLGRWVVNDFESGNTIQMKGWILSITEAQQCALYSLLYP